MSQKLKLVPSILYNLFFITTMQNTGNKNEEEELEPG